MSYNLEFFGNKIKELRRNLNLTQNDVAILAKIDAVTVRRIEKGKVLPNVDTLEALSPVLKEDLNALLLEHRFDNYMVYRDIKVRLESKFDRGELDSLQTELDELNNLLSIINNNYYKVLINQLALLTKGITIYRSNDYKKALDALTGALVMANPEFNIDLYNTFVYSSVEIRILMNVALTLHKLGNNGMYLQIMEFCIDQCDSKDEIFPKLCHNLAGAYRRNNQFEKALSTSNMGIKSCQVYGSFNGINLLYYGKGISELKLGIKDYKKSFEIAITLCEAMGQNKLKDTMARNCKTIFGVDI